MRKLDSKQLEECGDIIKNGGLAVILTDTIYGIVCEASNEDVVKRLYELKSRDKKPGTVIASSIDQLVSLGVKRRYLTTVEQFWPNPISIEIPHDLNYLSQHTGRQAFRITADINLRKLLDKTGPLLTSSANLPGEPPARNLKEAENYFAEKIDYYLDGGEIDNSTPSTLIRIVDDAVEVLRQGSIKVNEKGEVEK